MKSFAITVTKEIKRPRLNALAADKTLNEGSVMYL